MMYGKLQMQHEFLSWPQPWSCDQDHKLSLCTCKTYEAAKPHAALSQMILLQGSMIAIASSNYHISYYKTSMNL